MEKQSVEKILERIDEHNGRLKEHHEYAQRILEALRDDVKELVEVYKLLNCWRETGKELRALQDSFDAVYAEIERLRRKHLAAEDMDLPRVIEAWYRSMVPYNSVILCVDKIENILGERVLLQELKQHKGEIDVNINRRRFVDLEESLSEFKQAIARYYLYASVQINDCVEDLYQVSVSIQGKITRL